jgi:hypothetical protein
MSHILSLLDSDGDISEIIDICEEEAVSFKAATIPKWMMDVIICVNDVTQTKTLTRRVTVKGVKGCELKIIYVGDTVDVITAVELFNYLRKTVTKASTNHQNEVGGKFKQWRSFAEGCSTVLKNRAKSLAHEDDIPDNSDSDNECDISNFELEDDDYQIITDDVEEDTSIVIYNNYKESKTDKIFDYLNGKDIGQESVSSRKSRIDRFSYDDGCETGKIIPLHVRQTITGVKS